MKDTKMVIVVRKDLHMRAGKIAAQAAHACLNVILGRMSLEAHKENYEMKLDVSYNSTLNDWLSGDYKKICLGVKSEEELLDIYNKAIAFSLPVHMVTDSGLTEFHGIPTRTCLAIGPTYSSTVDQITGNLSLL